MEELVLTDPVVEPEKVTSKYKVMAFSMDYEGIAPVMPPAVAVPGIIQIRLKDNLGVTLMHQYVGQAAMDYIKFINTANFTTKSLHKRILERLSTEGVIPGTVTGTPDP